MPMAVALLGLISQAFVTGATETRRIESRTEGLTRAQTGLDQLTRELRHANWVHFFTSQIIDADVPVRSAGGGSQSRHVRYDCSAGRCWRYEGPQVAFPPPWNSTFEKQRVLIGSEEWDARRQYGLLRAADVFFPRRIDPATGATQTDYLTPNYVTIRLRVDAKWLEKPIELADGVALRNVIRRAG